MGLCTIADVKAILDADPGDVMDAQIQAAIDLVNGWLPILLDCCDPETGVSLLERFEDRVEKPAGGETFVRLRGMPVLSIAEVVEASTTAGLDDATALSEDDDWYRDRHFLHRLYAGTGSARPWDRFVRVTYTGGYDPAGTVTPTLALPPWLVTAAAQQASHMARHWEHFGQADFSVGTGSVTKVEAGLHKDVREILTRHRRMVIG